MIKDKEKNPKERILNQDNIERISSWWQHIANKTILSMGPQFAQGISNAPKVLVLLLQKDEQPN